ncbi:MULTISPECIES: HNH endonuclease signature motif containing protein [Streptomyces]|uniref:HNH endonuclease signature motif containing protein n=1 Tax=Streptomyces TaxID=1883 RepID=UPI001F2181EB|nr:MULTISPECIES: HNH endonuclease signature motif containing protein [Streptomyces]
MRKGQTDFRMHLLSVFGEVCAFTGPAPAAALEAAHLDSYAVNGKHQEHGGLLLRSDLHRLFDRGLIAVNPKTQTLHLDDSLHTFPDYAKLDGAPLAVSVTAGHIERLARHWTTHRAYLPN